MSRNGFAFVPLSFLLSICFAGTAFAETRCPSHRPPLPVHFRMDSAEMLPIGRAAVTEMLHAIKLAHPDEITLTGHADDHGNDERNMRLSERRARVVAAFLKKNGVAAKIVTLAKGKTEPHRLTDDPARYTAQQISYLNRRVEWKFEAPPPAAC